MQYFLYSKIATKETLPRRQQAPENFGLHKVRLYAVRNVIEDALPRT